MRLLLRVVARTLARPLKRCTSRSRAWSASHLIDRAASPREGGAAMEARTLTCDGRLIANVDLADTYCYDRDWYDHVLLFKNETIESPGGLDR